MKRQRCSLFEDLIAHRSSIISETEGQTRRLEALEESPISLDSTRLPLTMDTGSDRQQRVTRELNTLGCSQDTTALEDLHGSHQRMCRMDRVRYSLDRVYRLFAERSYKTIDLFSSLLPLTLHSLLNEVPRSIRQAQISATPEIPVLFYTQGGSELSRNLIWQLPVVEKPVLSPPACIRLPIPSRTPGT